MNSKFLKFEIGGIIFISLLGSILHFTFNWLGRCPFVGIFSAVNESTWEHLKLAVVPAIIWALLENKVFKLKADNFLCAKALGIWLMPVLIVVFFYSYTAILGYNLLAVDISLFVLSVIIGQIVSYKAMTLPACSRRLNSASLFSLILLLILFIIFTFWPPHIFLFKDPVSGYFGIIN